MCLPVIAPILAGVVSGVGAAMGAKAQQAQADANAALNERQAKIETETGAYKAQRTQDQVDRTLGAQRAGFAANGVALSGSAEDVVMDSAEEGALDVAAIRWNSRLASDNFKYQAKIDKMNSKIASKAAPLAFIAPVIGGIGQGIASYQSDFS